MTETYVAHGHPYTLTRMASGWTRLTHDESGDSTVRGTRGYAILAALQDAQKRG